MRSFILPALFLLFALQGRAQSYTMVGNELRFEQGIAFRTGTADLTVEDIKTLTEIKTFLDEKQYVTILRIEGHVEGSKDNQLLSEQRALAAAQWLIKSGIDCHRLIAVGFGNTKPDTQNTRMIFQVASLRGKAIGGMPTDGGGHVAGDLCNSRKSSR